MFHCIEFRYLLGNESANNLNKMCGPFEAFWTTLSSLPFELQKKLDFQLLEGFSLWRCASISVSHHVNEVIEVNLGEFMRGNLKVNWATICTLHNLRLSHLWCLQAYFSPFNCPQMICSNILRGRSLHSFSFKNDKFYTLLCE